MASYKLVVDDLVEDNYHLIAIHSALEDYRTAFLLNKYLNIQLTRADLDIDFTHKTGEAVYMLYKYDDVENMINYFLINNKYEGKNNNPAHNGSLFTQEVESIIMYLVPEFKKVDYFLKIEDNTEPEKLDHTLMKIKKIPQISTAYFITPNQIKNQENLIFG